MSDNRFGTALYRGDMVTVARVLSAAILFVGVGLWVAVAPPPAGADLPMEGS